MSFYAITDKTFDGVQDTITINWSYLEEDHVYVFVDGVAVSYTFLNASTIKLDAVPADQAYARAIRQTDISVPLIDYNDGAQLLEEDLDTLETAIRYVAQEQYDQLVLAITQDATGLYNAGGVTIINVADPINAQDAATRAWVETLFAWLNQSATLYGATADRPGAPETGTLYYDTDLAQLVIYTGTAWQLVSRLIGDTASRPVSAELGTFYYDTDVGQLLYFGANGWSLIEEISALDEETADFTLALTDLRQMKKCNSGSAIAVTVPANATVAFPVLSRVHLWAAGAGAVTVVEDTGVTVNTSETLILAKQHAVVTLLKVGTDEWLLMGYTEAA